MDGPQIWTIHSAKVKELRMTHGANRNIAVSIFLLLRGVASDPKQLFGSAKVTRKR